ncbi:hypothetical protein V3H18_09365 [Methylocystis sp. 9N]|uniref:Uncharacterized protein n=1 Tax=Methylocystis borbori TaxID=3118750 RepID=A0ABU7XHR6_9HYPH
MSLENVGRRYGAPARVIARWNEADLAPLDAHLATVCRFAASLAQAALVIAAIILGAAAVVKFVDALLDAICS